MSSVAGFSLVNCDQGNAHDQSLSPYYPSRIPVESNSFQHAYHDSKSLFLRSLRAVSIPFVCGTTLLLTACALENFSCLSSFDIGAGLAAIEVAKHLLGQQELY